MSCLRHGVLVLLCWAASSAQAAVSLAGTRLIFDGSFREASIQASNRGEHEVLIQTWLSAPHESDETPRDQRSVLPFVVTPHFSHLPAGGKQLLRVLYQGSGMPMDRESLLHLYVLEVPRRREGNNQLNIAVRQRINVFYRPPALSGDPADTALRLGWSLVDDGAALQVSNPTSYHATLQTVKLDDIALSDYLLLEPGGRFAMPLPAGERRVQPQTFSFKALTDYGGQRTYCMRLNGRMPFTPDPIQLQEEC
ncbi:Pili assembly chaperone [Pseudomonas cichorii]|uniref:Pili assembly chaperone n=2 Tax=Pseudomonas cichorii TaxID=36746 RepID=A0A3M4LTT2_PSECI|nr:molecular chaperone [Pseudomonas cichorii]RMQ44564.1 Pili assembly chaperone [Pseudomonas cichorii]